MDDKMLVKKTVIKKPEGEVTRSENQAWMNKFGWSAPIIYEGAGIEEVHQEPVMVIVAETIENAINAWEAHTGQKFSGTQADKYDPDNRPDPWFLTVTKESGTMDIIYAMWMLHRWGEQVNWADFMNDHFAV